MVTEDTVAEKLTLLCPADMVTLEGTLTLELLLEIPTVTLAGAGPVSVAVQDEAPGAFTLAGEQLSVLKDTVGNGWLTEITPPVPDALMELELGLAVTATIPPI